MFYTEYELSHYNKGYKEGYKEGLELGIKEVVQKFYQNGSSPEFISKSLKKPLDEVLDILELNQSNLTNN